MSEPLLALSLLRPTVRQDDVPEGDYFLAAGAVIAHVLEAALCVSLQHHVVARRLGGFLNDVGPRHAGVAALVDRVILAVGVDGPVGVVLHGWEPADQVVGCVLSSGPASDGAYLRRRVCCARPEVLDPGYRHSLPERRAAGRRDRGHLPIRGGSAYSMGGRLHHCSG